jgi:hypothetical protein
MWGLVMKSVSAFVILIVAVYWTAACGQVIYNNASTAGESYARGLSGIIQAQGDANLSNSQAAINLTDARSAQIDNQVKSVNAFWEKKDIYYQHQQEKLAEISSHRERYMARHGLGTLSSEEFDRTTGQINWPRALQIEEFDQYRTTLDQLFQKRAYEGALTGDEYLQATTASKEWRAALNKQRDKYPRSILEQLNKFILKVNRELNDNLS